MYVFLCRYGDKAPKSLFARLFATVWMVGGIILLSLFTAQVSSRLTAQELKSEDHLFGKKVTGLLSVRALHPIRVLTRLFVEQQHQKRVFQIQFQTCSLSGKERLSRYSKILMVFYNVLKILKHILTFSCCQFRLNLKTEPFNS